MIVKKIYMEGFGKFSDKTIEFSDGLTVIEGGNESGKTTVAMFLLAMFYGIEKKRPGEEGEDDMYQKFLPWDNKDHFGGSMDFEHDGVMYRLTRNFLQPSRVVLRNLTESKEIFDGEKAFEEMRGISFTEYLNSYFNCDGAVTVSSNISQSLKKHLTDENRKQNDDEADGEYALSLLEEQRRELLSESAEQKIKDIKTSIREEEKNERNLDRLASDELEGLEEIDRLNSELEKVNTPSEFEQVEQDYYTHKERFKSYTKDVEKNKELSEQLEKTILKREELDENLIKLDVVKNELNAVRKFKKESDEKILKAERDIEKKENRMTSDYRNGKYRAISLLIAAIVLIVLGIIFYIILSGKQKSVLVPVLLWIPGLLAAAGYVWYMMNLGKNRKRAKEQIDSLKAELSDIKEERSKFKMMHSSEDELVSRYEEALKSDGLRNEIVEKEQSLSDELTKMENDLSERKEELVGFFSKFGPMDVLKADEIALQEQGLVEEKEKRLSAVSAIKEQIGGLSEKMMKLRLQIEAGEENENSLLSHREQLRMCEEEAAKKSKEIEAVELAIKTLEDLIGKNHVSLGKVLNQRASEYAANFSSRTYTSFVTDEAMNGKVDRLDKYVPVTRLSRGAGEQMKLALRMASGDILTGKNGMPIVFDDAFVYYDDERLAGTLKSLGEHPGQKIILSCHRRAETILGQLNVEYEYKVI